MKKTTHIVHVLSTSYSVMQYHSFNCKIKIWWDVLNTSTIRIYDILKPETTIAPVPDSLKSQQRDYQTRKNIHYIANLLLETSNSRLPLVKGYSACLQTWRLHVWIPSGANSNLHIPPHWANTGTKPKKQPLSMMNLNGKNLFHNGCKITESQLKPIPGKIMSRKHHIPTSLYPGNTMSQKHHVPETSYPSFIISWKHNVPETPCPGKTMPQQHHVPETSCPGYIMSWQHNVPETLCPWNTCPGYTMSKKYHVLATLCPWNIMSLQHRVCTKLCLYNIMSMINHVVLLSL